MYPVSHLNESRLSKLRVFFVDLLNRLAIILMEMTNLRKSTYNYICRESLNY